MRIVCTEEWDWGDFGSVATSIVQGVLLWMALWIAAQWIASILGQP